MVAEVLIVVNAVPEVGQNTVFRVLYILPTPKGFAFPDHSIS